MKHLKYNESLADQYSKWSKDKERADEVISDPNSKYPHLIGKEVEVMDITDNDNHVSMGEYIITKVEDPETGEAGYIDFLDSHDNVTVAMDSDFYSFVNTGVGYIHPDEVLVKLKN